MDAIVSTAIEEICAEGAEGITPPKLWRCLRGCLTSHGLPMDGGVKGAIWRRLLALPCLQFSARAKLLDPWDPSIGTLEQAEKLELKVAAVEAVRDSFLGLYDLKAANVEITPVLRQIIERIAVARSEGIAQSQLSKEFKMKENKLFYFLKKLDSQRLIVRQSTILRTKEAGFVGDDAAKDGAVVNTNSIFLYRYAKQLGSLQRLEIATAEVPGLAGDTNDNPLAGDLACEESTKEDVLVKDFLPEMKAICDMLEEASGKVLVVSDIKLTRGYRMRKGHRSWRNICNRMKDAGLVEDFPAKVNGKVVKCLRLLKKFDAKDFQPKILPYGLEVSASEPLMQCGRRGQITDQVVELPIEHLIYDIIDAEGPKGITMSEVSRRLGLNSKRTDARIYDMCWRRPKRFPLHMQFEIHNKTKIYRVWTHENFVRYSSGAASHNHESNSNNAVISGHCETDLLPCEQLSKRSPQSDCVLQESYSKKITNCQVGCSLADANVSPVHAEGDKHVLSIIDPEDQLAVVSTKTDASSSEKPSPPMVHSSMKSFSATTVDSARRERRILSRLKSEKFLLTVELYKWLESLENDRQTTMARKTLARCLQKLQEEGHCKCVQVTVPALTNCKRNRATEVILHPSIGNLSSELLLQIHKRLRDFDMQSRQQGLSRSKNDGEHVTELEDVKRHFDHGASDIQSVKIETMRANGYIPARIVRAKLLHSFLWNYTSLSDCPEALSANEQNCLITNLHHTRKLFSLSLAIEHMPLELFLQVVGSDKRIDNLVERCNSGLVLSDLPINEYRNLMDTLATGRLSRMIDILFRLKLIQLSTRGIVEERAALPHCTSMHSLELKPYIEVPRSFFAYPPRLRHDFLLSCKEAVDSYWQTLEYCYAGADRASASHAFPGSAVPEVFLARSWTSVRAMTAERQRELFKCLQSCEPNRKLPFGECVKISKEMDLSIEQILHFSYDMRRPRRLRLLRRAQRIQQELNLETHNSKSTLRKRKRRSKVSLLNQVNATSRMEEVGISDEKKFEDMFSCSSTAGKHDGELVENVYKDMTEAMNCGKSKEGEKYLTRQRSRCQRRFLWTDILDRKLIIQYVKNRASGGAKFSRVDWSSILDLPADPDTCKRRMHVLNSNMIVRKAVLKLCNIVSASYAQHLHKRVEGGRSNVDSDVSNHDSSEPKNWDDFGDPEVKLAVDYVLHCKGIANLEIGRQAQSRYTNIEVDNPIKSRTRDFVCLENDQQEQVLSSSTGSWRSLHKKFLSPPDGRCLSVYKQVQSSVSVANAVELFKLVFLSTSTAPEVRSLLAETLNCYSEHDLTTAFNYLKDKKFMEHGQGNQQLFLSQRFLNNAYSSPFPIDSGKRATNFSAWLLKEEERLMEDGINLDVDLQCGEVFHLFALLSSGRLSIAPCMPKEGVGDAEDPKSTTCDSSVGIFSNDDKTVKQKMWWRKDCEPCNRREKGFPGIQLLLKYRLIPTTKAVACLPRKNNYPVPLSYADYGQEELIGTSSSTPFSHSIDSANLLNISSSGSLWESIVRHTESLSSVISGWEQGLISPELIRTTYMAIHEAGDQGLSIKEISENVVMHGEKLTEILLDALRQFQLIVKVNAYDHVRVVDSSFKAKYFVTTLANNKQSSVDEDPRQLHHDFSCRTRCNPENAHASESSGKSLETSVGGETIQDVAMFDVCTEKVQVPSTTTIKTAAAKFLTPGDSGRCRPILPWINGDGSTNETLYRALVRRILGIVMQNPGILEEDLIRRMDVLNPQNCRDLLEVMALDNHIMKRRMHQTSSCGPPSVLKCLFGANLKQREPRFREHYFANPMSTFLL